MNLFRLLSRSNNKQNKSDDSLTDLIIKLPDNIRELYEFMKVRTLFNDVVLYTININKIITFLQSNKIVPGYYINKEIKEIFIHDFFIHDEYAIDIDNGLQDFHKACIVLFNIYDDLLNNNDKTLTQDKNLLIIKPIINNIITLIGDLKNAVKK